MKKLNTNLLVVLMVLCVSAIAEAQTKTVTLTTVSNYQSQSQSPYNCSTNQIISIISFIGNRYYANANIAFANGINLPILPYYYGMDGNAGSGAVFNGSGVFTGVTNITVNTTGCCQPSALTFTVTTPTDQSSIPANAVVIPTDATGPVQIVLESSADLVNWTSALPGTYGNTYTNRFFRVRAIAQ